MVDLEIVPLEDLFCLKLAIEKGHIFVSNVDHVNTGALELLKQKLISHDFIISIINAFVRTLISWPLVEVAYVNYPRV